MANITAEHLHHMAKRHHATMKELDGLRAKFSGFTKGFVSTLETGAGAWIGGAIEGKTGGGTVMNVPWNLGAGLVLLAAGHLNLAGEQYSEHLNNVGNGFVGSYVAATGYAFGKRWRETGKLTGGGGHPFTSPYESGWSQEQTGPGPGPGPGLAAGPATPVQGNLSQEQMAAIVQRMQAAAGAPAYQ